MFVERKSAWNRLKEAFHPTPMRDRIGTVLNSLKIQLKRLERKSYELQERDRALYTKCISTLQGHNDSLAKVYANECAEIRKIAKITLRSQLALEKVTIRLETVREFGDVAYTMKPLAGLVGSVRLQLENVMPEVSQELAEVDETLNDIIMQVGEVSEEGFDLGEPSEEAREIMEEANVIAEQKMKDHFPDLPTIPTHDARI